MGKDRTSDRSKNDRESSLLIDNKCDGYPCKKIFAAIVNPPETKVENVSVILRNIDDEIVDEWTVDPKLEDISIFESELGRKCDVPSGENEFGREFFYRSMGCNNRPRCTCKVEVDAVAKIIQKFERIEKKVLLRGGPILGSKTEATDKEYSITFSFLVQLREYEGLCITSDTI